MYMLNRIVPGEQLIHKQKVAFLGPAGTYSHTAVKALFGHMGERVEYVALPSIADVFLKVDTAEVNLGVVPVENSIEGVVRESIDSLITRHVCVVKEYELPIDHCLLSKENSLDEIKIVRAHPQALAQCKEWLERTLPGAILIPESSNVAGASTLAPHEAIIAAKENAEHFSLTCLGEHIGDKKENATLFYTITKDSTNQYTPEAIAESVDAVVLLQKQAVVLFFIQAVDKPGILRDILAEFADVGLRVRKVHSLPTGAIGSYYFLLDVVTSGFGVEIEGIYKRLKDMCTTAKVLGVL